MNDKAIISGKEHRKQYIGAKLCDRTCRNHGSCPQCEMNRTFSYHKREWWSKQEARHFFEWDAEDPTEESAPH